MMNSSVFAFVVALAATGADSVEFVPMREAVTRFDGSGFNAGKDEIFVSGLSSDKFETKATAIVDIDPVAAFELAASNLITSLSQGNFVSLINPDSLQLATLASQRTVARSLDAVPAWVDDVAERVSKLTD